MTKEEFSAKLDYIQEHVRLEAKFKFEEVKEKLLNIPRYKHKRNKEQYENYSKKFKDGLKCFHRSSTPKSFSIA